MANRGFSLNVRPLLLVAAVALGAALLTACGGGGDSDGPTATATTAPAGENPTATDAGGASPMATAGVSPTAETTPAQIGSFCDLVTPDEADDALGEFVTGFPCGTLNGQWQTDSGLYVRLEPGSAGDLLAGAEMEGVAGELVAGVGDKAA